LTLNVVRPAGVKPEDDLPVGVWVHGGVSSPEIIILYRC
jgi:carboxylesterase type B